MIVQIYIFNDCKVQVTWNNLFSTLSEQPLSKITPLTGKHFTKPGAVFSTAHLPAAEDRGESAQAFHHELQLAKKNILNTLKNEPFSTHTFAQH